MPVEITVGLPQLVINQGDTILVTDNDGQIPWPSDKGLYFLDTRLISSWNIFANGAPFELLNSGAITHYAARVYLTNPVIETEQGDIPEHTLSLVLSRSLDGGVHEDIDLTNQGMKAIRFNLEIAVRSDFADIFEVKSKHIIRRGRIVTEWSADTAQLRITYRNKDFGREVNIRIANNDAQAVYANGRLSFEIDLAPGASWHSCILYELGDGKLRIEAPKECIEYCGQSRVGTKAADWKRRVLKIRTTNEEFYRLFDQAVDDMAALRLPFEGTDHLQFVPVAGVPWFVALFGRDSLIVSLQNALVYPGFARGALQILGSLQAKERDDYRDAEPGKIMHELRRGELAHFKLIPHTPYYGTADATILYLIVLHAAWLSTGDAGLIENHLGTAENCLEWIDKYGDRDGDGFQEYDATRDGADRLPAIPGHEFSGIVEAAGADTIDVKVGQAVYALTDFWRDGSDAEYIVIAASDLAPKPQALDFNQAAAIPLSALTAWQGLFDHGMLATGQKVLIHGAAGGVGSFAVQLANWRGAHVIGTASAANLPFLRTIGAHDTIDYKAVRFEDVVHDADVVLDTVGGDTLERSWPVVRRGGVIVTTAGEIPEARPAKCGVRGVSFIVTPSRQELVKIKELIDGGIIRPIVSAVFPLAQARQAFERGIGGHTRGKLVLSVQPG